MLRNIIIIFTLNLIPISAFAQCTADAQLISQSVGTIYLSGMSTISSGLSSNNSLSYEWDFRDGTTSNQQNPCHTYGDLSSITSSPIYVKLTITYFDSLSAIVCQAEDSVYVGIFYISPCKYGDLKISASGSILSADLSYQFPVCGIAPFKYIWSNGDTTQTIIATNLGSYSCTVTTAVGCVYTSSYTYNGSFIPSLNCEQIDMFEIYGSKDTVGIKSNYLTNNSFPEIIDSLSYWEAYSTDGNILGLAPIYYQNNAIFYFLNNGSFMNPNISNDTVIVNAFLYLYDSLYQYNPYSGVGSTCNPVDTFIWDGNKWSIFSPAPTYYCDPIDGCFIHPYADGEYSSLSACEAACNTICDSVEVGIKNVTTINQIADSITLGTNVDSLFSNSFINNINYEWIEWISSNNYSVVDTSESLSFSLNSGDTAFYVLKIEIPDINSNSYSWVCFYPLIIYGNANQYSTQKMANPMTSDIPFLKRSKEPELYKIVNILGQEVSPSKNVPLFYIYEDGSVQKKMIIE